MNIYTRKQGFNQENPIFNQSLCKYIPQYLDSSLASLPQATT